MTWDRPARTGAVAALLAAILLAGGCGTDSQPEESEPDFTPETETTSAPAEEPTLAVTTSQDAGEPVVSDALIDRLIEVADGAGYGPADESFALLMVDTCRDIRSDYSSWDELIAQDVADGAPRSDAESFYEFLRNEFCPAVKPLEEPEQAEGEEEGAESDGTRGLGSTVSFLDSSWERGSLEKCRAATGAPLGEARAYTIPPGVLVCADYLQGGFWGETLINVDAVFDPAVSEADARGTALRLLPEDASFVERFEHTNPGWAARDGSCVSLVFESSLLEDAIHAANADWSNADEATATLYSDKQTDYGSGSQFDGSVHVMSLSIGGDAADSNC